MIRNEVVSFEKRDAEAMRRFHNALEKLCAEHRVQLTASDNGLYVEVALSENTGCDCLRNADL